VSELVKNNDDGAAIASETLKRFLQSLPPAVKQSDVALWFACCAELRSEHPLGNAILNSGKEIWGHDILNPYAKGSVSKKREDGATKQLSISDFQVVPGRGVQCTVNRIDMDSSCIVRVGNRAWVHGFEEGGDASLVPVQENGGSANQADEDVESLRTQGQIGVYVSVKSTDAESEIGSNFYIIGIIGILDPIKKEAKSTVAALQSMDIDVWMCTGDHELTAQAVARQIGIDEKKCMFQCQAGRKGRFDPAPSEKESSERAQRF